MRTSLFLVASLALVGCTDLEYSTVTEELLNRKNGFIPNGAQVPNSFGHSTTYSTLGSIDLENEFFQDLGVNGRRCVSCHLPTAGWSITPEEMQDTFDKTDGGVVPDEFGLGAAFRLNDGANRPDADVSTLAKRRTAYSMLLNKGLIRVGLPIPANAEFVLEAVDDPYGFAHAGELSLFRRPLPSTNLKFLSAVMWDGRESVIGGPGIHFDLTVQSNSATMGHAQSTVALTDAQRTSIVAFELSMHTAQEADKGAGSLSTNGAGGGAAAIVNQNFYIGINDVFGDPVTGLPHNPNAFTLYTAWANNSKAARAQIARGQQIFNTKTINIQGVSGINDDFNIASLPATCTFCHDTPNGGNHSTPVPLDIGLVAESERTPDLPLYVLKCVSGPHAGKTYRVTDPGRALISGKCAHIGRFKGPILRGLASRAPYFHNGSAASLLDAVNFYDRRFDMKLTPQEKADLVAFLATL
jgi:cytochrome c peroxidase